jgi:hypothetical protein
MYLACVILDCEFWSLVQHTIEAATHVGELHRCDIYISHCSGSHRQADLEHVIYQDIRTNMIHRLYLDALQ